MSFEYQDQSYYPSSFELRDCSVPIEDIQEFSYGEGYMKNIYVNLSNSEKYTYLTVIHVEPFEGWGRQNAGVHDERRHPFSERQQIGRLVSPDWVDVPALVKELNEWLENAKRLN